MLLRTFPALMALVGAMLLPDAAAGQGVCPLCDPQTESRRGEVPEQPLRIEVESALDFSRLALAGSVGDASIDPATGNRSTQGGLMGLGGMPFRGTVRLTGTPRRPIRVDLPRRVQLRSSSGGIVEVYDIATDLPPMPMLGADGRLSFSFGGRLVVKGSVSGTFRGQIPVTADYQ